MANDEEHVAVLKRFFETIYSKRISLSSSNFTLMEYRYILNPSFNLTDSDWKKIEGFFQPDRSRGDVVGDVCKVLGVDSSLILLEHNFGL